MAFHDITDEDPATPSHQCTVRLLQDLTEKVSLRHSKRVAATWLQMKLHRHYLFPEVNNFKRLNHCFAYWQPAVLLLLKDATEQPLSENNESVNLTRNS